MDDYYSKEELCKICFCSVGKNVFISKKVSIYNANIIKIGNNVRIDDFCILSGKIIIGNNVHISAGSYLFAGEAGIIIEDYSSISSRCAIYAITDDYSGEYLANPTVPAELRNVIKKEVIIKKYSIVGTGSTILPGVIIEEGCSVGAMSLVKESLQPWGIYVGIPCKRIKEKSKKLLSKLD